MSDYERLSKDSNSIGNMFNPFPSISTPKYRKSKKKYVIPFIVVILITFLVILSNNRASKIELYNKTLTSLEDEIERINRMKPELNKKNEEIKKICTSRRTILEAALSQKTQIRNKINEINEAHDNRLLLMKQYESELPSIDKNLLLEKENEAYIEKTLTDLKEENNTKHITLNQLNNSYNEIEHLVKIAETVKSSNILKSIDELNVILQWINKGERSFISIKQR